MKEKNFRRPKGALPSEWFSTTRNGSQQVVFPSRSLFRDVLRRMARADFRGRVDVGFGVVDGDRCFAEAGGDQLQLAIVGDDIARAVDAGNIGFHSRIDATELPTISKPQPLIGPRSVRKPRLKSSSSHS